MRTTLTAWLACVAVMAIQCTCLLSPSDALVNNPSAEDVTSIQQTLALFPVAVDLKQFHLLDAVFSPDATANFSGRSVTVGASAIKLYLSKLASGVISQHNLGTLYVNMTGPHSAAAYNWLHGTFFGTGNATGQSFSNFGYYKDDLVRRHGRWYIQNRVLVNFGRYGNESLIAASLDG
ncbi:MAG: hypothetical protein Q9196_004495 [Gyalolechia fulgens]